MKIKLVLSLIFIVFLSGFSKIAIVKKQVVFDERRIELSLQYLKQRHGLDAIKAQITPKMIVVHYTVIPTLEGTMKAFNNPELPGFRTAIKGASSLNVSSQFVIDRDGTIYQILPEETTFARHVIGLNYCAFGIENVGGGKDLPLTDAQLDANVKLISYLKNKYQTVEYLIGHQEYNQFRGHELWKETDAGYRTEKSDPGVDFMQRLREKLSNLTLKGPPETNRPKDFVDINKTIENAIFDIRYFSDNNFLGVPVEGYEAAKCILQEKAADALKKVADNALKLGLRLKIFDCFRPQRSVDHFVRWAANSEDIKTKQIYYPNLEKQTLIGPYIAAKSGHSRGATIDLTLVENSTGEWKELDMGGNYDFFGALSNTDYQDISKQQKINRYRLKSLMEEQGFSYYDMEWWHFSLQPQPYPDTYFDFIVR